MTKDLALLVGADTPFLTTAGLPRRARREPAPGDGLVETINPERAEVSATPPADMHSRTKEFTAHVS